MITEENDPIEYKRILDYITENIEKLKPSEMTKGVIKFEGHVFNYSTRKFESTIERITDYPTNYPTERVIEQIKLIFVWNLEKLEPLYILTLKIDEPDYVIILFKTEPFEKNEIKTIWFDQYMLRLKHKLSLIEETEKKEEMEKAKEQLKKRLEFYESVLKTLDYLDLIDLLDD